MVQARDKAKAIHRSTIPQKNSSSSSSSSSPSDVSLFKNDQETSGITKVQEENRTKNCIIKALLENLKLMQHPTISKTMYEDFDKKENSEFIIAKDKARQNKQKPIKVLPFESSNSFQTLVYKEESNDGSSSIKK